MFQFMRFITVATICFFSLTVSDTLAAPNADKQMTLKEFSQKLTKLTERQKSENGGTMGIYFKKLGTKNTVEINADEMFPTASTIKLPVACTLLTQMSDPQTSFPDYFATKIYDGSTSMSGSGFLQNYKIGTKMEIKELLHLMITVSDNTATNMLTEWLGGPETINNWLQKNGFEKTRMFSTVGGRIVSNQEGRRTWGLGVTTPREMGTILERLSEGKLLSTTGTEELLRILGHQYFDDLIASEVPPKVWVGSKSGALNASRSDCAIVSGHTGTYLLVIFTKENKDTSWGEKNFAEQLIKETSALAWKYTNPRTPFNHPKEGRL